MGGLMILSARRLDAAVGQSCRNPYVWIVLA
jgi:hypothetical protein